MKYTLGLAVVTFVAAGCQQYRAQPLDTDRVLGEWRDRSAGAELAKSFADALTTSRATSRSTFNADDGISLAEAEIVALVFNPALRKARLEANVARVGAAESGRLGDPSISVDIERIISGANDPWIVGGLVNLTIPLSGRLQSEKKVAIGESDVARWRALLVEREMIAQLRATWAEWSSSAARLAVVERAIADLAGIAAATSKLRDAGEIDPADARLFSISLHRRKAQLLGTQRDMLKLESQLRGLIGLAPAAPLQLEPCTALPGIDSPADVQAHPKLTIARAEYDVAERSLELEIRKQYPDVQLGGGVGTDEGDTRLLGGLSIPLPLLNGNRRAIAEARARRDAARVDFENELFALETARAAAASDVDAARATIAAIEQSIVPLVDQQVVDARKLLDAGEFDSLLLRDAIDSAADTKLELIDAQLSLQKSLAEQLFLTEPLNNELKEGQP